MIQFAVEGKRTELAEEIALGRANIYQPGEEVHQKGV